MTTDPKASRIPRVGDIVLYGDIVVLYGDDKGPVERAAIVTGVPSPTPGCAVDLSVFRPGKHGAECHVAVGYRDEVTAQCWTWRADDRTGAG